MWILLLVAIKAGAIRFLYKPGCGELCKSAQTNLKFQDVSADVTSSFNNLFFLFFTGVLTICHKTVIALWFAISESTYVRASGPTRALGSLNP